ncbi:MAG: hypothetical protein AAFY16_00110 [Cyanobacteria bacterium J06642_3]
MTKVTLSDRGEESFGASFAHHKNLLLVGSPSAIEERGAWLYNLDELDKEPEKLAAPNIYLGNTVALNERFAVVGDRNHQRGDRYGDEDVPNKPTSTLIRVNETGSTRTQQFRGKVSLSDNILVIMRPTHGGFVDGAIVEVYGLTSSAGASLLSMRGNVANAFVQNGFFFGNRFTYLPFRLRNSYSRISLELIIFRFNN